MNIAICDDMKRERNGLSGMCGRYSQEHRIAFCLDKYDSGEALLACGCLDKYDLIFLDIYMKKIDGIGTAKILRERGYEGAISFITVSDDFYAEGFELNAIHYLLKPVTYEGISSVLGRALKSIKTKEAFIEVMTERVLTKIILNNIIYIEVYGHETIIHTVQGEIKVNMPLGKLEEEINSPQFLKCYRSYMVNMDYIQSIKSNFFLMENGTRIPISKKSQISVKRDYMNYVMGSLNTQEIAVGKERI